ncbi:hypothetical protein [Brevundimonas subvibrioides]|uniref:hypothetical protein n=1 Tax=Brevundimonas subvibrioides TaxID=74313 RepID=UPI0022B5BC4D|nr:hypothetical protein [Brevundimonas subvibrioides]
MSIRWVFLALAMAWGVPAAASGQDLGAYPTWSALEFGSDYRPDPVSVSGGAGGPILASSIGGGCAGLVSSAPNVQLTYWAVDQPLYLRTAAAADTTLLVHAPNGSWYCDDNGRGGLNAQLYFPSPDSGTWLIYVGAQVETGVQALLEISGLPDGSSAPAWTADATDPSLADDYAADAAAADPMDLSATAPAAMGTYGTLVLDTGFWPSPNQTLVYAGGDDLASNFVDGCVGLISTSPDVLVTFWPGSPGLDFKTVSTKDTTILLQTPSGDWYCDDDSGGSYNAELYFPVPEAGTYSVWVGAYGEADRGAALLEISEKADD